MKSLTENWINFTTGGSLTKVFLHIYGLIIVLIIIALFFLSLEISEIFQLEEDKSIILFACNSIWLCNEKNIYMRLYEFWWINLSFIILTIMHFYLKNMSKNNCEKNE